MLHTSTAGVYGLPRRISGATWDGVPHCVWNTCLAVLAFSPSQIGDDHGGYVVRPGEQEVLELEVPVRDIVEVHVREGVQELSSDHLGVLLLFAATKYIRVGSVASEFLDLVLDWRPVDVWGYARIRAGMNTRSGLTHGVVAEVQQRVEQLAAPEVRHHDVELAVLDKVLFDVHHVGVLQFFITSISLRSRRRRPRRPWVWRSRWPS